MIRPIFDFLPNRSKRKGLESSNFKVGSLNWDTIIYLDLKIEEFV
jgi:hypothetical protein